MVIDHPQAWQDECERLIFNLGKLLDLAGQRWSTIYALRILESIPRDPEEQVDQTRLWARRVLEAATRSSTQEVKPLSDYFIAMTSWPPAKREALEARITGVLLGLAATRWIAIA